MVYGVLLCVVHCKGYKSLCILRVVLISCGLVYGGVGENRYNVGAGGMGWSQLQYIEE